MQCIASSWLEYEETKQSLKKRLTKKRITKFKKQSHRYCKLSIYLLKVCIDLMKRKLK